MDIKELTDLLAKFGENGRNAKYIAWWDEDPDGMYRYSLFKQEEIVDIEACVAAALPSDLAAPCGTHKFTLFHLLVWHNFYNAVKGVLKRKAVEPDITDGGGKGVTALMLACSAANLKMVKLLLESGADEKAADSDGRNCFHYLTGVHVGLVQPFRGKERTYCLRAPIARLLKHGINAPDNENKTPLAQLIMQSDRNISYSLIDAFIEKGADCGFVDEDGDTLLHIAIKNRHFTAALRLADPENMNVANKEGKTPLQLAETHYCEGSRIVLRHKGGIRDAQSRIDLRTLKNTASNAFACGNELDGLGIALYLTEMIVKSVDTDDDDEVECIADLFFNALSSDENCSILDICAAAKIDFTQTFSTRGTIWCLRDKCLSVRAGLKAIEKLAALGVDLNSSAVAGKTPVNIIAGLNKPNLFGSEKFTYFEDSVKFFSPESMNALNNDGTSAMHLAALRGHTEMLKAMIDAGADVNVTQDAPAEAGDTPLHVACFRHNADSVKLLIENGADETICNVNGEAPVHMAFYKSIKCGPYPITGDLEDGDCGEMLLCLKNLDAQRNDGRTPLMQLQFLNINFITYVQPIFLDAGVDVNKTDNFGSTALILATQEHCYKEPIKELIRIGADVNHANNSGKTALHCALKYGSQDVARYLIKKGADYNRADNDGVTPVQIAAEKGYDAVLELMTNI
ncbi:MAG: ankyrin repeat domain-containing protein [Clostridia bacterium]|nr:ankyrin repeat domain-containing protein [Clostridia bacterium]MDE7329293.1 ankyrin repeat domain-containing protein [Clostridia bacterium]